MGKITTYRAESDTLTLLDIEGNTFDESTLQLSHGVYTVMRLYPGVQVFRFSFHYERLKKSTQLFDQTLQHEKDWLRAMLRRAIAESGVTVPRIRLTVPFDAPQSALIMVEEFQVPDASLYEEGVKVNLVEWERDVPRAKNTPFIEQRKVLLAKKPADVAELVMTNSDGFLSEGMSSNFCVVVDGKLRTAEDRVLEGVARSVLLDVVGDILPLRYEPLHRDDLSPITEAMLISGSQGVVPVVQINGAAIGDGRPGEIARRLNAAYNVRVQSELEPL